jgi:hypothetical protein
LRILPPPPFLSLTFITQSTSHNQFPLFPIHSECSVY